METLTKKQIYALIVKKCRAMLRKITITQTEIKNCVGLKTGRFFSKRFYTLLRDGLGGDCISLETAKALSLFLEIDIASFNISEHGNAKKLTLQQVDAAKEHRISEISRLARSFFSLPQVAKFIGEDLT